MDLIAMKSPYIVDLPKITDHRGNLTFVENNQHIPFEVKRIFYLYDVPADAERGAHAHKELYQFVTALSGSFNIAIDDGYKQYEFHLRRPWQGVFIPNLMWSELKDFSSGAVCCVLASEVYIENDYIRNYQDFLSAVGADG